jgi:hypothetical protein
LKQPTVPPVRILSLVSQPGFTAEVGFTLASVRFKAMQVLIAAFLKQNYAGRFTYAYASSAH